MWTYSPSSEVYLKRFLGFVRPPDENNKWVKRFKKNVEDNTELEENDACKESIVDVLEIPDSDPVVLLAGNDGEVTSNNQNSVDVASEHEHEFITLIEHAETDLEEKLLDICNSLGASPQLFPKLAEKLSITCIEKLTSYLLGHKSLDPAFMENFYKDFFPPFLKREYTRITLDVLLNSYKKNPDFFKKYILMEMLKNVAISNKVISFVETLNEDEELSIFNKILEVELSTVEFLHNLTTIFTLYKNSKKSPFIQTRMEKILVENSEHCSKENTFGKLLLLFLQHQKIFGNLTDPEKFKKCVEIHQTPFKKPCLNIMKEM